jgi:hypothetical protein
MRTSIPAEEMLVATLVTTPGGPTKTLSPRLESRRKPWDVLSQKLAEWSTSRWEGDIWRREYWAKQINFIGS